MGCCAKSIGMKIPINKPTAMQKNSRGLASSSLIGNGLSVWGGRGASVIRLLNVASIIGETLTCKVVQNILGASNLQALSLFDMRMACA